MLHANSLDQINTVIAGKSRVLIDFFATWCGPCKRMTPLLEKLEAEDPSITIVKVDTDESNAVDAFNITSMPTFIYYQNGQLVRQRVGGMAYSDLQSFVQ